jgi:acetyl-CoA synthetase
VVSSNFDSSKGKVFTKWFSGGETNICYNAVDRHVEAGHGDQIALYHEANDEGDDVQHWTYKQVLDEVSRVANVLKSRGVKKGDRVTLFMPMVPHLPIAMLACARIGAVHSVVFGGFSAEALANRIVDADSSVVVTANGVMRGKKPIALYDIVNKACTLAKEAGKEVTTNLILNRLSDSLTVDPVGTRDIFWEDVVPKADAKCDVEWVEAEHPLFVLYTSGSTGKPKGVLHTTGGYMVGAATTSKYIFDLQDGDTFFCTADCGWITGHSYVAYGPMLNRATQLVFEGVPSHPDGGRLWRMVDKYKVTQLYTAPTAIRALMALGDDPVKATSRASLKLLGSVGEPINPEAWRWYHEVVGDSRCPIVDTWWQTETGSIMITPLPTKGWDQKPGMAMKPFFGIEPVLITPEGKEITGNPAEGLLAIKSPWPSTIRDVLGDYERYRTTYFPIEGFYLTGDGARRDADGDIQITGRVDDVINVSGHRIGTAEVESAAVLHPDVAEAAVVGYPHPVKGEGIYIYVTLNSGVEPSDDLKKALVMQCRAEIGAFAAPDTIHWAPSLPKTRSGKIMRRILRKIAELGKDIDEEVLGDTSTLADPGVVTQLIDSYGQ